MTAPELREEYLWKLSTATTCYTAPQQVTTTSSKKHWNAFFATEKHVVGIQLANNNNNSDDDDDDVDVNDETSEEHQHQEQQHDNDETVILNDENKIVFDEDPIPIPSGVSRKDFKKSICVGYHHCQGWEAILLLDSSKALESDASTTEDRNNNNNDDDRTTASTTAAAAARRGGPRRTVSNSSGASVASSADGTASTSATSVSSAQGIPSAGEHRGSMGTGTGAGAGAALNSLGHLEEEHDGEEGEEEDTFYHRPLARLVLQHRESKRQYTKPLDFRPLSPCISILSHKNCTPNPSSASDSGDNNNNDNEEHNDERTSVDDIVGVWVGSADDSNLRLYRNGDGYILTEVPLQDDSDDGHGPRSPVSFDSPIMAIDYLKTKINKQRPIVERSDHETENNNDQPEQKALTPQEDIVQVEETHSGNIDERNKNAAVVEGTKECPTGETEEGNPSTETDDPGPQNISEDVITQLASPKIEEKDDNFVEREEGTSDAKNIEEITATEPLPGDQHQETEAKQEEEDPVGDAIPLPNEEGSEEKEKEAKEDLTLEESQDNQVSDKPDQESDDQTGQDLSDEHGETQEAQEQPILNEDASHHSEEMTQPREQHHLAVACQDGTIRFLQFQWSSSDLELEVREAYSVIVDGPIVGLHLNHDELRGHVEAVVGSLCGYVARFIKPYDGVKEEWEGPFMVAEGFWNSRQTQEDSVLTVHAWDKKVAVGTFSGRCLLYEELSSNRSDDFGQPFWDFQLPDPINGICHIPSESSILLLVTTRRSIHVFQEIPKSYDPDMAKRKLQFLKSRTRPKMPAKTRETITPSTSPTRQRGEASEKPTAAQLAVSENASDPSANKILEGPPLEEPPQNTNE